MSAAEYLARFIERVAWGKAQALASGAQLEDLAVFLPASRDIEIDVQIAGALLEDLPIYLHMGAEAYVGVMV